MRAYDHNSDVGTNIHSSSLSQERAALGKIQSRLNLAGVGTGCAKWQQYLGTWQFARWAWALFLSSVMAHPSRETGLYKKSRPR